MQLVMLKHVRGLIEVHMAKHQSHTIMYKKVNI